MSIKVNFAEEAIIGKREEQQDSKANLIVSGEYMLYVLADGMGGQVGGAHASKTVCSSFLEYFSRTVSMDRPVALLEEALHNANRAITDILRQKPVMKGMGTTVIALLFHQPTNRYWFLSVGDSPLYKLVNGQLQRINANHAYYEDLLVQVKQGEISQKDADEHPQRHAITSAIMGGKINHIDTNEGVLNDGELLLIASDGVQTLDDQPNGEIAQLLSLNADISTKAKGIIQAVNEKDYRYQDNTTLIIVEPVSDQSIMAMPKTRVDPQIPPTEIQLATGDESDTEPTPASENSSGKWKFISIILLLLLLGVSGALVSQIFSSDDEEKATLQVKDEAVIDEEIAQVVTESAEPDVVAGEAGLSEGDQAESEAEDEAEDGKEADENSGTQSDPDSAEDTSDGDKFDVPPVKEAEA